jgi:excinuclease UvrABC ATPase subunit
LDIPKRQLTAVTGVSCPGKSSPVFDIVAAESQRLINETYSAFVQSFLPHYGRPDVDSVANLSAAIVIARADWVIDLGPAAGHDGGRIVCQGTPADLLGADTLTARHLRAHVRTAEPTSV